MHVNDNKYVYTVNAYYVDNTFFLDYVLILCEIDGEKKVFKNKIYVCLFQLF